jgi:ATP-dependent DNA ligase
MMIHELAQAGKLHQNAEPANAHLGSLLKYAMQHKLDGHRVLAEVLEDKVIFYTRTGKTNYTGKMPEVEKAILAAFPAGSWLDGEAISDKGRGQVQSELASDHYNGAHTVYFVVFDLIAHRGIDIRTLRYEQRRSALERIFEHFQNDWVQLVPSVPASWEAHDEYLAEGGEGTVLKHLDGQYHSGKRGYGWVKAKGEDTFDAIVTGFEPGKGSITGLVGAIQFSQYKDGELVQRGTASGFDMLTRMDMTHSPEAWLGTVVEIRANAVMKSGALLHPRYIGRRTDKAPAECVWA